MTDTEFVAWVDQFAAASEDLKQRTADLMRQAWAGFDQWYDTAAVTALAKQMADLSVAAQQTQSGLAGQYVAAVTAAALLSPSMPTPTGVFQVIRNSVPLTLVHTRPAEAYKRAVATGSTHEEALVVAGIRAAGLAFTDLTLQERASEVATLEGLGVTGYRRIIHPELSKTGTCGLCIAASDRIYSIGELMPIHPPECKCTVAPIIGGIDPGRSLNDEDLARLYDEAGSNKAADLRRTRYQVNEHGEFGPVITRAGDAFRGPDRVALENDPERAARMLDKVAPVLTLLEGRAAAGENVTDPLQYQRDLIARLRRIVGDQSSAA